MEHAWRGYSVIAFGHDELRPVTIAAEDGWGRVGATIIDALDTLMVMDMHAEVQQARQFIDGLNWTRPVDASFFEYPIRFVGGLLAAYDLSHDVLYLAKAEELAARLLPAWDSPPHWVPKNTVNLLTSAASISMQRIK